MTESEIYDGVIANGAADFALVVETLRRHGASWCAVGGMAVNSYTEPVYTVDFELVVAAAELEPVLADLRAENFWVKYLSSCAKAKRRYGWAGPSIHRLMTRFITCENHQAFVENAEPRPIFGTNLPVAALADLVQAELWTRGDPLRRLDRKMLAETNLMRLAEAHFTEVAPLLPEKLRLEAEASLARGDEGWGGNRLDDDSDGPASP